MADRVKYLRVRMSGKTGERYLIAKREAVAVLRRMHGRQVIGLRPRTFNGMFDIGAICIPRALWLGDRERRGTPLVSSPCFFRRPQSPLLFLQKFLPFHGFEFGRPFVVRFD